MWRVDLCCQDVVDGDVREAGSELLWQYIKFIV